MINLRISTSRLSLAASGRKSSNREGMAEIFGWRDQLLRTPSQTNPVFSRTCAEARFSASQTAQTWKTDALLNAHRTTAGIASAIKPRPQWERARRYPRLTPFSSFRAAMEPTSASLSRLIFDLGVRRPHQISGHFRVLAVGLKIRGASSNRGLRRSNLAFCSVSGGVIEVTRPGRRPVVWL